MIKDLTNGKLAEIKAYAAEHNLEESFNKTFARFERHSQEGNEVKLYADFAPTSLYFEIFREGRFILNGGFIFHSPHDGYGKDGFPTFSVCIEPERSPHWEIHT